MKNIITIIFLFLATTVAWGQSCSTFQGTDPGGYVLTAGQLALSGTNSFTGAIGERYKLNLIAGQTYTITGCTGFGFGTDLEFSIFNYATTILYQVDSDGCGSSDETYTFVAPYTGLYWLLLSENACDLVCTFGCTGTITVTCTTCPSSAPAVPPIGENNPVATDFCTDAPLVQNLSGYAGSTSSAYTATGDAPSLVSNFCGSIENNSFIKFVASSTTSTFEFWIPSCSVGVDGVQFQVFSVTGSCSTGTWTSVSNGCVNPTGGAGSWGEFVATGLTIGNTYYIVFDGFAGNVCDYVIKAQSGVATCPLTPGNVSQVCNAAGTSYTVEIPFTGGGTKTYTITGGTNTGDNPSSVASGTIVLGPYTSGTGYTINISTADGICDYDFSVPTYSCPDYCAAINPVDNGTTTCGTPFNLSYVEQPVYEAVQTSCGMVNVSSPTIVTLTDDDSELDLPIGFTFNFFGTTYTTFNLHSNGIISFDAPGSDANGNYLGYSAVTIPNGTTLPNNYIAGLYTDLNPTCGGSVTYKTIGTAPNRQLVVTWTNIEPYQSGCGAPDTEEVTFQIVLTEGTNAINTIVSTLPSTFGTSWSNPSSATQGVEAGDGAVAFTTPGRNWQVWTGVTPTDLDCTTFQPVPLTVVFNGWYTGGAGGTLVGTGNPQAVTPAATTTYTGSWTVNGRTCTKDVVVTISGGPTITLGTATNVTACGLTDGTIPLTFTNVPNGTYTLSYEKDGTPATASITVASNAATLTGLGAGSYANFSITVSGCTATAAGPRSITAPSAPVTTGATICTGGSGTLTSSVVCPDVAVPGSPIAQGATFNSGTLTTADARWTRNAGGTTCNATATDSEYYDIFTFTVSANGSYTLNMCTPGTNWDGHASLYQNAFSDSAPCGVPANFIIADDDGNSGGNCDNDARLTATLSTGITYYLITTEFSASGANRAYAWTFTGPASATISPVTTAPGTLQWYTAATGGTPVQTGSPFNPVGDAEVIAAGAPYSSLTNTNTPGTYTFYAACSGTPNCRAATNFVINAGPSVTASNDGPLTCNKTSVTLSPSAASGTVTYAWSGGSASVTSAGTYTVTATDSANGCQSTSSTTVTSSTTPPTAGLSNNGPICSGSSVTLTATPATGATYQWSAGATAGATNTATASPTSTTTYTVTVTDSANGCPSTSTTTVTVVAPPNAGTLSGTQDICVGGTTTFTSNGDASGTWSSSNTAFATVNASTGVVTGVAAGTATITYTVAATAPCTGDATATRTVTVVAPPTANAGGDVSTACSTAVTLGATGTGTWSGGAGTFSNVNSPTSTYTPTAGEGGTTVTLTWTVAATSPCTGSATDQVAVTVGACGCAAPPSVIITQATAATCGTSAVTLDYTVANGPATVTTTGGGTLSTTSLANGTSTFTYTPVAGDVAISPITITATIADPDSGGPCIASTDNVSVTVTANPTPNITSSGANLCNPGSRTLAATPTGGTFSVLSGPGSVSGTTLTASGIGAIVVQYSVTVGGCTGTTTQTITTVACTRSITITDPCSCNNDATTSVNGLPALPVVDGTFDETVGIQGLFAGDVIDVVSITGLYVSPGGAAYDPATAEAGFAATQTATSATLTGAHIDNVGYTIMVDVYDQNGTLVADDLTISNKCAYPNPDFTIGNFADCATPIAITLTHSSEGNGTASFNPALGGTSPNYTLNPAGLTGAQTITLTYTGINDGNGGVSPDGGTTPAFPGCQEVIQKSITVNCPGCAASSTMQWGNQ